uniref:Uncharacterized protein n=1 Tax=Populus trichocarpa TaxID=3694 RepID=A0A2K1R9T1_POPTR
MSSQKNLNFKDHHNSASLLNCRFHRHRTDPTAPTLLNHPPAHQDQTGAELFPPHSPLLLAITDRTRSPLHSASSTVVLTGDPVAEHSSVPHSSFFSTASSSL